MNALEKGFLLLSSHLGNPERKILTPPQLRTLAQRVVDHSAHGADRDLSLADLTELGFGKDMGQKILELLSEEELLERYLRQSAWAGCVPLTRVTENYPSVLRKRLGGDSPGCLWAKGNLQLLNAPALSLVGSRQLREENRVFAEAVGRHAANRGIVLVSGNARGADRTAQDACLEAGGRVISVVADDLTHHSAQENILYLSEEDYDAAFSAQRALRRNRCIHTLGQMVFVAQAELGKGGTWNGTVQNLRHGWSPVLCFQDGSDGVCELEQLGAYAIGVDEIADFDTLPQIEFRLF